MLWFRRPALLVGVLAWRPRWRRCIQQIRALPERARAHHDKETRP